MNMFTKKSKKFILVLVLLILFNFCCPKNVNAALGWDDFEALPVSIIWMLEKGILWFANNIFTEGDDNKTHEYEVTGGEDDKGNTLEAERLVVKLTPENIIKGKFLLFDANIFKNIEKIDSSDEYFDVEFDSNGKPDLTQYMTKGKIALRNTIAGWYYALRNFAIVALLSVLVYVGIRMILSSIAQDKAKYKTMFKDWLVALCLVVVMHYMMIAILNITSMITDAFGGGQGTDMVGDFSERISGIIKEQYADNERKLG